ncbi:MAG: DUF1501 domain-containing protein [Phycisphaerales bacterium]|nr:DUF1501 domain-containing protein [Phycisphaerales bacterium]
MLSQLSCGFGALALGGLYASKAGAEILSRIASPGSLAASHFVAQVRSVIFLYQDGGPSQMDTFDPKPRLTREHGQPVPFSKAQTQFNNDGNLLASPWKFARHGECGMEISELFPHIATMADELCVVRSMTSEFSEHTNANYFLHTGAGLAGRPSMGAWCSYGLGCESANLPGFVVLDGGLTPPGGLDCFSNGFLPATHQASRMKPRAQPIANLTSHDADADAALRKRALLARFDDRFQEEVACDAVESAIANQELAFRMQSSVPELAAIDGESETIRSMYGFDAKDEATRIYAHECLLARRLVERGVRFVELTIPKTANDRWDQHSDLRKGHEDNARAVDQPTAALLYDLKRLGLLESTLVVWAGEFGRTPFAQGSDGRDHNPFGYSIFLAGGGVKRGHVHGATDEYGYKAVEQPVSMHDLHATILHLLGVDHRKLTWRFGGRDMRLTDVHGNVISGLLA